VGQKPSTAFGCDVGRFNDRTAVIGLHEHDEELIEIFSILLVHSVSLPQQGHTIRRLLSCGGKDWTPTTAPFVIDITGVGIGLYDNLLLPRVIPVTIVSGEGVRRHRDGFKVGKSYLMALVLQSLIRLRISAAVPGALQAELKGELQGMRVRAGKTARYAPAKSAAHDDLVLALSLALFGLERIASHVTVVESSESR
jgi:hypothetical protein